MGAPLFMCLVAIGIAGAIIRIVLHSRYEQQVLHPLRARAVDVTYNQLPVLDLAYLAGGPRRALLTAMALTAAPDRSRPREDPLVSRLRWVNWGNSTAAYAESVCSIELDAIRSRLYSAGLLVPAEDADRIERQSKLVFAISLGLILTVGYLFRPDDVSTSLIFVLCIFIGIFAFAVGRIKAPRRRSRLVGRALPREARSDFSYLDPWHSSDYRAYGAWALPLATALFGREALAHHPEIYSSGLCAALGVVPSSSGGGDGGSTADGGIWCGDGGADGNGNGGGGDGDGGGGGDGGGD